MNLELVDRRVAVNIAAGVFGCYCFTRRDETGTPAQFNSLCDCARFAGRNLS